jgi:hypothetical protein
MTGRRSAAALLLALAASGCRYGFDASPDAEVVATGAFSPPRLIAELSDPQAQDDDPTLTADRLELYFESNRFDAGDVFVSRRASVDAPWGAPTLVAELSSTSDDETPEVAADGLTIFLASNRPGGVGGFDVYIATRANREAGWSTPVLVSELNTPLTEAAAATTPDLLDAVFHADPAAGANLDIYEVTRTSIESPWSPRRALAELDTPAVEATPFLMPDGLTIYFISDRPGGAGDLDMYVATRPSRDAPFSPPVSVAELNTASAIQDPWLSGDGHHLVFVDDGAGSEDLYEADR